MSSRAGNAAGVASPGGPRAQWLSRTTPVQPYRRASTIRYLLLDLIIDISRQSVERDGAALDVGGLSFRLLACLVSRGDQTVSFDELMTEVWAPAVVNEETITQRVKLLRQSLGDDGRKPKYIRSVRGRGYQLCAPPSVIEAPVETPVIANPHRRRRWLIVGAGVVIVLAGAGYGLRAGLVPGEPRAPSSLVQRAAYYADIGQAENNERAIALYTEALQANPDDELAMTGMSRAFSARACLYNGRIEDIQRARELAQGVAGRNERSAAAWSALAYASDCEGRIDDAIRDYERSLSLDPEDDRVRSSLAYLDQEKGRIAEALHMNMQMHGDPSRVRFREVQIAREVELLGFVHAAQRRHESNFRLFLDNVFANIAWPRSLFQNGSTSQAQAALDQALTRGTPHVELLLLQAELALSRGDRTLALKAWADAASLRPRASLPQTLSALYGSPPPDPAWIGARIADLLESARSGQVWPSSMLEIAVLELARDNKAAAVGAIGKAVDAGFRDRAYLQTSPLFKALVGDQGFAQTLDRIAADIERQRREVMVADWKPTDVPATSP